MKEYEHAGEMLNEFMEKYDQPKYEKIMDAYYEFVYQCDMAEWKDVKERLKFEIQLKNCITEYVRYCKKKILK